MTAIKVQLELCLSKICWFVKRQLSGLSGTISRDQCIQVQNCGRLDSIANHIRLQAVFSSFYDIRKSLWIYHFRQLLSISCMNLGSELCPSWHKRKNNMLALTAETRYQPMVLQGQRVLTIECVAWSVVPAILVHYVHSKAIWMNIWGPW